MFLEDLLEEKFGFDDSEMCLVPESQETINQESLGMYPATEIEDNYLLDEQKLEIRNSIEEASQQHFTEEDMVEQIEANSNKYHSSLHPEEAEEINDAIEFTQTG